jgi:hypothetical protein
MGLDDTAEIGSSEERGRQADGARISLSPQLLMLPYARASGGTLEYRNINGLFHRPCAPALLSTLCEVVLRGGVGDHSCASSSVGVRAGMGDA